MAQTNYTPIILYNSGTTGNTPSTSNLASGELAINYTDGKLFYKDNSSTLQVIGWKTTPTTAGGTGLTSYTAGDLPYYSSGTALSKIGIGTSGYVLESNGSAPTWVAQSTLSVGTATNATNTAITDNTSSSATWYPTIVSATTGNLPQTTSSTKLSFVPSTGTLTATSYAGAWAGSTIGTAYGGTGLTSLTSGYIPYGNGTSAFSSSSNLTFNGTILSVNGKIGAGTTSPSAPIEGVGNGVVVSVKSANDGGSTILAFKNTAGTDLWDVGIGVVIQQDELAFRRQGSTVMYMASSGGVAIGSATDAGAGNLYVAGTTRTLGYTVATLPTGVTGMRAYVTNALAPTFGSTVVGGGTVTIPVFYNGTNWIVA
jgi:hypothetical protein